MITETREIYKCEHCRKMYQRQSACITHETKCTKNPINIPKCYGCDYLENIDMEFETVYQSGYDTGEGEMRRGKCFKCKTKNVFMYPPKAKHGEFGLPDYVLVDGEEITQEEMPIQCGEFRLAGLPL